MYIRTGLRASSPPPSSRNGRTDSHAGRRHRAAGRRRAVSRAAVSRAVTSARGRWLPARAASPRPGSTPAPAQTVLRSGVCQLPSLSFRFRHQQLLLQRRRHRGGAARGCAPNTDRGNSKRPSTRPARPGGLGWCVDVGELRASRVVLWAWWDPVCRHLRLRVRALLITGECRARVGLEQ